MRTALMLLIVVTSSVSASQNTVWKWVDEQGVTHYSDRPRPDATAIQLSAPPPGTTPSSQTVPVQAPVSAATEAPASAAAYTQFSIEHPQPDQAIINTGGVVTVSLQIAPSLRPGHVVSLLLDGEPVIDFPPAAQSHALSEVPRGTHTLQAFIRDTRGTLIQQTDVVSFHVRQNSIAQPPVGPALRSRRN